MTDVPSIRPALDSDYARIAACAKAAYVVYVDRIGKPPAPMVADFASLISENKIQVLELRQQLIGYVVSYPRPGSDDQPVGDVQSTGVSGKTYVMHGGTCFIENIAVFPQYQGSGYGKLLVDRVIAMARQCCCCSVELYTNALMVENIEWYNKLGFEEFERKYEEGFSRVYLRRALSG